MDDQVNRKKILPATPILLFFLLGICPVAKGIGFLLGYDFILYSDLLFAVVLAAFSCIFTVSIFCQHTVLCPNGGIFAALLLPFSVLNLMCFVLAESNWLILFLSVLPCICSFTLFIRYARPQGLAVTAALLAIFWAALTFFLGWLIAIFAGFGKNTVVKTLPSPWEYHLAQVVDSDQGALGGNTVVKVIHKERDIFLLAGRFVKKPSPVYAGEWGEADGIALAWTDEHTLYIDGVPHRIIS